MVYLILYGYLHHGSLNTMGKAAQLSANAACPTVRVSARAQEDFKIWPCMAHERIAKSKVPLLFVRRCQVLAMHVQRRFATSNQDVSITSTLLPSSYGVINTSNLTDCAQS